MAHPLVITTRCARDLGTMTDEALAEREGVSTFWIAQHRRQRGIPAYRRHSRPHARPAALAVLRALAQAPGQHIAALARQRTRSRQSLHEVLCRLAAQGLVRRTWHPLPSGRALRCQWWLTPAGTQHLAEATEEAEPGPADRDRRRVLVGAGGHD